MTIAEILEPKVFEQEQCVEIEKIIHEEVGKLAPFWSIENFIAVNPLVNFENLAFQEAIAESSQFFGANVEASEHYYREQFDSGRITIQNLSDSLKDFFENKNSFGSDLEELLNDFLITSNFESINNDAVLVSEILDAKESTSFAQNLDSLSSWWSSSYLSDHPAFSMPNRDKGIFIAWSKFAPIDRRFSQISKKTQKQLFEKMPDSPIEAVIYFLRSLGVESNDQRKYISRHIARHPGWASAFSKRDENGTGDLVGYIAMRLGIESLVSGHISSQSCLVQNSKDSLNEIEKIEISRFSENDRISIWRNAFEKNYSKKLIELLNSGPKNKTEKISTNRPKTHSVFCIDTRSEAIRRHLEGLGENSTIGFAGFFGLPVSIKDLESPKPVQSCPVIIDPQIEINENLTNPSSTSSVRKKIGEREIRNSKIVFSATKRSTATPFVMAEAFGWIAGPVMALKTFFPNSSGRLFRFLRGALAPELPTELEVEAHSSWGIEEQTEYAISVLKMTGLDSNAAPLVLFCGHGSQNVNNLHKSSLDCGACGGRPGGNNARIAVMILNNLRVRENLADRGIEVPSDTFFVAAEHNTTTDMVTFFDLHGVPDTHLKLLNKLRQDLEIAGEMCAADRSHVLLSAVGCTIEIEPKRISSRATDWAQVIAEWGLVNNAALIVGPRSLTKGMDLERRVFLHEYENQRDIDGSILSAIVGGPLVVAHWINSQYRMSSINPHLFGAGKKPLLNLVGGIGVFEGIGGDLRQGLPFESVSINGKLQHEPMRLLVVIDAPIDKVMRAIKNNEIVKQLVENQWIKIAARDQHSGEIVLNAD